MKNKKDVLSNIEWAKKVIEKRRNYLDFYVSSFYKNKVEKVKGVALLKVSNNEYIINEKVFLINDEHLKLGFYDSETHNKTINFIKMYSDAISSKEEYIESMEKLLNKFTE